MTPNRDPSPTPDLSRFRDEILRWNESFSLVSRTGTEARVDALLEEGRASYALFSGALLQALRDTAPALPSALHYVDLGSGAGLPGVIWHLHLQEAAPSGWTHAGSLLVEPRGKRAWFLERMIQVLELEGCAVGSDQWGRRSSLRSELGPEPVLGFVTLKALHLTDEEILAGWRCYRGNVGDSVVICRFHPAATPLDGEIQEKLGLPAGSRGDSGPWCEIFSFETASNPGALLVSVYPSL